STPPRSGQLLPLPCPLPKLPPAPSPAADVSPKYAISCPLRTRLGHPASRETSALAVRCPSPVCRLPVSLYVSHSSKETTPPAPHFGAPFPVVPPASLPQS